MTFDQDQDDDIKIIDALAHAGHISAKYATKLMFLIKMQREIMTLMKTQKTIHELAEEFLE